MTQFNQFFILHQKHNLLQQEHANVLNQLSLALQSIANQSLEIQVLKDEIARLKGTSPRPKLPPNRLEGQGGGSKGNGGDKPGRGKHLMIEAGIFASLIEHGVPRDLHIHSDDAGQFELFKNSLCWIHEERHYRKLVPAHPEIAVEIEKVRDGIWQLYKNLKNYKEALTELERIRISQSFEDIFRPKQPSMYQVINDRLALTYAKRDRLLVVLDHPTTPLHNNLSEIGGRGAKVKNKISGGTRSDLGRRAWDTFGRLNLTCRRLGISFYDFLMDRLLNLNKIACLGEVICERIQSVVTRNAVKDLAIVLNVA